MLGRTISFWRRLVRGEAEPAAGGIGLAEEERRVWVRFPANLETTFQAAGKEDRDRLSARVVDISRGGVNLVVNRAFRPGHLLSVELPIGEEPHNVLACIVRVNSLGRGEWSLGCIFSRELSDADLKEFGAKKEKPPSSDQRTWIRFSCNVKATYQLVGDKDEANQPAQVLNLSASGVGLLVTRAIETGTLLTVELLPAHGSAGRTMLACVVHANTQGEGHWALGCNFIHELSEDDLKALLA